MAKLDKKTRKILDTMVKMSFDNEGNISEVKVRNNAGLLSGLPRPAAIAALSAYLKRIKSELDKTTLKVESPLALDKPQVEKIKDAFAARYPVSGVKLAVDSSLFGGVKVKLGDMVFDDTIKNRISQLKGAIKG